MELTCVVILNLSPSCFYGLVQFAENSTLQVPKIHLRSCPRSSGRSFVGGRRNAHLPRPLLRSVSCIRMPLLSDRLLPAVSQGACEGSAEYQTTIIRRSKTKEMPVLGERWSLRTGYKAIHKVLQKPEVVGGRWSLPSKTFHDEASFRLHKASHRSSLSR